MRFLDDTVKRERRRSRFARWRVAALLACTFIVCDGPSMHSGIAVALGPAPNQSRLAAFARPELEIAVIALEPGLDLRRLAFASTDVLAVSQMQQPPAAIAVAAAAASQ
jgi:hypothetical protein